MKNRIAALLLAALLVLSSAAMLSGCGSLSGNTPTVSVQSVEMITGAGNTGVVDRMSGKVISSNTLEIHKQSDQKVVKLNVKVGDEVKKGDVLFSYDQESLKLAHEKLLLEKEQYQNLVKTIKQKIETLKKNENKGSEAAKLETSIELQTAQIELKEAEYNLVDMDQKIADAKEMLSKADYAIDIDGRVQSVNEELMDSSEQSDKPFITVVETGAFRIEGRVSEMNLSSIGEGDRVVVRSRTDSHVVWRGEITQIKLDTPESGNQEEQDNMYGGEQSDDFTKASSYPFYVTLDDASGLILGQHVFVEPDVGQCDDREGIWLPAFYICDVDSNPYVWKANSRNRLVKSYVKLGTYSHENDSYEILSGVEADDYLAFPDESCVEGAKTEQYDESSFAVSEEDSFDSSGDEFSGDTEIADGADDFEIPDDFFDNGEVMG